MSASPSGVAWRIRKSRVKPRCGRRCWPRGWPIRGSAPAAFFFVQLIERLGIAAEVNARAVVIPSGFTAEKLVTGEVDLAVQQISELKQVAGIEIVGPIPRDLQTPAVFSAGLMATSDCAGEAGRLLRYLASPEVAPALRESGLEP